MKRMLMIGLAAGFSLVCGSALAAPVVSPGALRETVGRAERSIQDNRGVSGYYQASRYREERPEAAPVQVEGETSVGEDQGISFQVNEVRVTKSSFLSAEAIREAVHFPGPGEMKLSDLTAMVDRLNALYKKKHILTAQAVLPPQTVKDGIVVIRLIEGKYEDTVLSGSHRISTESVLHTLHTAKGELVDIPALDKDLRMYNAGHVYRLSATVVPGKEEGTSDVELTLAEPENPMTSFIFTDNAGQKESGRYRIGAYTEYRGIGGHDAGLAVAPVWTDGIWGGSVVYDTPWGHHGTRANISYSRNLVDIVDGPFEDFDIKAQSNDLSLGLTQPLNVTQRSRVDVFVEGHRKWSDTTYAGMKLSDRDTRTLRGGVTFRSFDDNGLWYGMVSVTGYHGKNKVSATENNGSYYNAYLLRRQDLSGDRYLSFRAAGQYSAFKELPSTEQMTLGGIGTVRGFEESLLSADKGWLTGLEYGFPLSSDHRTWRGFTFLDHGVGYSNYGSETEKDFLTSAGLGVEYAKGGWYGKVVLGVPLNHSDDVGKQRPRVLFYVQRNV